MRSHLLLSSVALAASLLLPFTCPPAHAAWPEPGAATLFAKRLPPLRAAAVAESLGPGIVRYWADDAARASAPPSLALLDSVRALGPATVLGERPEFGTEQGGWIVRLRTARGTSVYGTGEVSGPLRRNGRVIRCWNTDAYGYDDRSESLYQSHPWVLALRGDGTSYGVLCDTPGRVTVDLTGDIVFRVQGPAFDVVVVDAPGPAQVVSALADLTGHMPLPPRWALGYHQCRYSYAPASQVLEVAREFRARRIPCDVMWMDIDYMDGHRPFTFDPRGFPDPKGLNDSLHALGFRSVWILDPGIRQEPGAWVYDQGTAGDHWVKSASGEDYTGRVWPGLCVFPDFTREATRRWWAGLCAGFAATGADGLWNDMNEPAVFDVASKTMPETNRHRADEALGGPGPHLRYHNVYGALMARASRAGLAQARPERRPFVLTRAGYLGVQRDAATWTGDNRADWRHLAASVPMALNLGLSGQPLAGPDIGGFAGAPDGRMFARWMGVGALLPFARGHSEKGSPRREPWSFGPEVEATCRRALETRYRLMPYLYTLAREASVSGLPVARPVFFADPADSRLHDEDHAFLLGADLLVVPDLTDDGSHIAVLPRGAWHPVEPLGTQDAELPRLMVRGGAIVPAGPVAQDAADGRVTDLELYVSLDAQGRAAGTLYEDAGDGHGHRAGEFRLTRYEARREGDVVRLKVAGREGSWAEPPGRRTKVTLLGPAKAIAGLRVEGP